MSPECRDLIDKLLNPDRDRRIGHRGAGEGEEGGEDKEQEGKAMGIVWRPFI